MMKGQSSYMDLCTRHDNLKKDIMHSMIVLMVENEIENFKIGKGEYGLNTQIYGLDEDGIIRITEIALSSNYTDIILICETNDFETRKLSCDLHLPIEEMLDVIAILKQAFYPNEFIELRKENSFDLDDE